MVSCENVVFAIHLKIDIVIYCCVLMPTVLQSNLFFFSKYTRYTWFYTVLYGLDMVVICTVTYGQSYGKMIMVTYSSCMVIYSYIGGCNHMKSILLCTSLILLHTVSVIHSWHNVCDIVLKLHTVTCIHMSVHTFILLHTVLIWLHTVNYTPPVSADICMVTYSFNAVFYGFYFVECPPLKLTLYTHNQVQKAIDGLTDPKYLEVWLLMMRIGKLF